MKPPLGRKLVSKVVLQGLRKYFRLQVVGAEHIPPKGPAIIAPNHSGFAGLDALLMADSIAENSQRIPRVLTHKFWFANSLSKEVAESFGFIEANVPNGLSALKKNNVVVIFPEGEAGNFKPSSHMYQLQEFRSGLVRMALTSQAPIVPSLVVGAEESQINLAQLRLPVGLKSFLLPLPLTLLPLPAKWTIHFFPPVELPYPPEAAENPELVRELSEDLHDQMQSLLNKVVQKRGGVFR